MEHGIVQDWNDMEQIWQYIYSKDQLQTFAEEVCGSFLNLQLSGCYCFMQKLEIENEYYNLIVCNVAEHFVFYMNLYWQNIAIFVDVIDILICINDNLEYGNM